MINVISFLLFIAGNYSIVFALYKQIRTEVTSFTSLEAIIGRRLATEADIMTGSLKADNASVFSLSSKYSVLSTFISDTSIFMKTLSNFDS